jgi:hypothetical protein
MISSKWLPVWLPLIGLASCVVDALLHASGSACASTTWLCNHQGLAGDFWMMGVPFLALLARGVWAGAAQVHRTNAALRRMLGGAHARVPAHAAALARTLGIARRLDMIEASAPEAFCYGLLRPRICITSGLIEALSAAELEAVLRHERRHLRRHDPLRVVLWTVISNICWWLEADMQQASVHRELAADRAVIAEQGRQPLASALYKLATLSRSEHEPQPDLALTGISVTDARIDQLVHPERTPQFAPRWQRWLLLPLLLLATMLACSVIMAHVWP